FLTRPVATRPRGLKGSALGVDTPPAVPSPPRSRAVGNGRHETPTPTLRRLPFGSPRMSRLGRLGLLVLPELVAAAALAATPVPPPPTGTSIMEQPTNATAPSTPLASRPGLAWPTGAWFRWSGHQKPRAASIQPHC